MKIFFLFLAVAVSCSEAIRCLQGRRDEVEIGICPSSVTQCSGPKFIEYTGVSPYAPYACGPCPSTLEGRICETCTGDSCNTPQEAGEDFKCRSWQFREGKWSVAERGVTCKRLKSTMIMCNMPTAETTADYKIPSHGCGPCYAAEKARGTCKDCNTPECNRAFEEEKKEDDKKEDDKKEDDKKEDDKKEDDKEEDDKKEDDKKEDDKEDNDKDNDYLKPSDGTLPKISFLVFGFLFTLLM